MAREKIDCIVNDRPASVETEPDRSLLEVLREDLKLTATKYGCGEGACGACTVMVDGERVHSCGMNIEEARGKRISTIEGLSDGDTLHRVQEAFLAEGALQCGYCTSGMIMNAVALLARNPHPSDEEIATAMDDNLCRCGGYPGMLRAVRRAADTVQQEVSR